MSFSATSSKSFTDAKDSKINGSHVNGATKKGSPNLNDNDFVEGPEETVKEINLGDYDYLRITTYTDIPVPKAFIKIANEIISTPENILTISGASKSGKSAFSGYVVSETLTKETIEDNIEDVEVEKNLFEKAVICFDTEQSRYKQQQNLKSIIRRAGLQKEPDYFYAYNIRNLDLAEYQNVTDDICEAASKKHNGVHLIVIDGIADYINDSNDPKESKAIVKYFMDLSTKYMCPIIVIVHTNPGGDKERGHLGSECQRKSESVLTVKVENDFSFLEPKFLRNADKGSIPLLQFAYDKKKGYHVGVGHKVIDESEKDKKRLQRIMRIAEGVFAPPKALTNKEAIEAIMDVSAKASRTATDMFTEMKVRNFVYQGDDKRWRKVIP